MTARFYVHEAHGYEIRPKSGETSTRKSRTGLLPSGFFVIDSLYAHRSVAAFPRGQHWYSSGRNFESARRHAHAKADDLNAWDAAEAA